MGLLLRLYLWDKGGSQSCRYATFLMTQKGRYYLLLLFLGLLLSANQTVVTSDFVA